MDPLVQRIQKFLEGVFEIKSFGNLSLVVVPINHLHNFGAAEISPNLQSVTNGNLA